VLYFGEIIWYNRICTFTWDLLKESGANNMENSKAELIEAKRQKLFSEGKYENIYY